MDIWLFLSTLVYIVLIFVLAILAKKKVKNEVDFLISGRSLSTFFASTTLFATWFGAGTLLTATDAIYLNGLQVTALEPFGAGACLLIAGFFFASPLWRLNILTIPDLFALKFGKYAEFLCAILLIPGYFGWIAVQITALAGIISIYFSLPLFIAMLMVTIIAVCLASLGGMWSVVLTDSVQMTFVGLVIIILGFTVISTLGNGYFSQGLYHFVGIIKDNISPEFHMKNYFTYLNVFAIAALGNLPGQDLAQRIFSARSADVAKNSCLIAGFCYIIFGSISIILGISARFLLPHGIAQGVVPHLARHVLSPWLTICLVLCIISIIISTMDSAMLATSSIISHNLIRGIKNQKIKILLYRSCIAVVGILSLMLALLGNNTYTLLEQSYAISLVGIFTPFLWAVFSNNNHEIAAILSMLFGIAIWILSFFISLTIPLELIAVVGSFFMYITVRFIFRFISKKI